MLDNYVSAMMAVLIFAIVIAFGLGVLVGWLLF